MNIDELRAWGQCYHFPQLALSRYEVLRAGELNWQRFLRYATTEQLGRAVARVERWMMYERGKKIVEV